MQFNFNIFSVLSFIVFLVYMQLGTIVFLQNPKSKINISFLLSCIFSSFWSFVNVFYYAAPTPEIALYLDKISSIGWIMFPTVTLAFFMYLTQSDEKFINKIIVSLFYLAGFTFIWRSLNENILTKEIILLNNIPFIISNIHSPWYYAFNIYIFLTTFIGFYFLFKWKIRINNLIQRRQRKIIIITILLFVVFTYLTDFIFPIINIRSVPTISNIFSIIWVIGVGFAVLKYKLMTLSPVIAAEEIVAKANDIIFFINQKEIITKTNNYTLETLKYDEINLINKPFKTIFAENEFEKIQNILIEAQQKGIIKSTEINILAADKTIIPVEASISLFKSELDDILGYVFIAHDLRLTIQLKNEINERKTAQENLKNTLDLLEQKVDERTAELSKLNEQLLNEIKEKERVEKALIESEERYRYLFDRTPLSIVVYDEQTLKILLVNKYAIDYYGYSYEEFASKQIIDILIPEDKEIVRDRIRSGLKNIETGQYKCLKKNGEEIIVETTSHELMFNNRKARIVLAIDITERVAAEVALVESEKRYRFLIEQQGEGIGITDLNEVFIFSNNAADDIFGVPRGTLVGRNLKDFLEEEQKEAIRRQTQYRKKGGTSTYELEIVRPDKTKRNLLITATPQFSKDKQVEGTLGIFRDITERKIFENQLKESEARLLEAQKIAKIGSWEIDVLTRDVTCSENFFKILGITDNQKKSDFNNSLFFEMLYASTPISSDDNNYSGSLSIQSTIPSSITDKKGRVRYINSFKEVEYNKNGEPKRFIVTIQDVTEQQLNEELKKNIEITERSAELKQQFLANMSHEIRTPLNAIIGYTNLLIRNTPLNDKQRLYLTNIKNSSDNLLVLINDILDLTKINAGKLSFEQIDFNLKELVHNIVSILNVKAAEKNITLNYFFDSNLPDVFIGDPVRLNQILMNLVGNAIKFIENQGVVSISVLLLDKVEHVYTLQFKISDTGIGIPKDKLESIFESFTQADSDTTRKYGGTGLGLAIVKQLIDLMNGEISVESEPGKGTTFFVKLAFAVGSQAETESETTKNETEIVLGNCHPSKINILLVEDNEINRTLAIETITTWDDRIFVETATNGIQAIEKIKEQDFHMILMDIQMPEMDGYETTNLIRQSLPAPKCYIPIIGMSAHVLTEEKNKCFELGMNEYITKPFIPEELFKIIKLFSCNKTIQLVKEGATSKFYKFNCTGCENGCQETETKIIKPESQKEKLLDLSYLSSMFKGDTDKMIKIIVLYLESIPKDITSLLRYIEDSNWKGIEITAHSFKPIMTYLGLKDLHELAKEMEFEAKKAENIELIKQLSNCFVEGWTKIQPELIEFTKSKK